MRARRRSRAGALAALLAAALAAAPGERALELRNTGLAELENEQPARAEAAWRELAKLVPDDPLPVANLAIALLRQQRADEALESIDRALAAAPGRADLLAIRGEILQWSGRPDEALAVFDEAAAAAPDDPEIQYAALRQARNVPGQASEAVAAAALERLARLRPENLLVLLERGARALAADDRAGASAAYLRVRELAWQAPAAAGELVAAALDALAAGDLEAARLPALRLENVLKVTPMYREGLRELSTGVQGVPLERFADEPPPARFGEPVPVRFTSSPLAAGAAVAIVAGDFDGDQRGDLAWLAADGGLAVALAAGGWAPVERGKAAVGATGLATFDLDNDGHLDLLAHGGRGVTLWRGAGDGSFADATAAFGLTAASGCAAAVVDYDIEGDLDLMLAGGAGGAVELYRNALAGPLEAVGERAFTDPPPAGARAAAASDLDRDGDLDLLVAGERGLAWLDNRRQGELADRTAAAGLAGAAPAAAAVAADLDNDGWPDLVAADRGVALWRNEGGRFAPFRLPTPLATTARFTALVAEDFDNDGRLDLAVAGPAGVVVIGVREGMRLEFLDVAGPAAGAADLAAADLDGDGDLDLVSAGDGGVHRLTNEGGNANHWLAVRLRGLTQGNSKNNVFGVGAAVEVRAGAAYQLREAAGDVVHFGLGSLARPDLLRVVWTNGVPQNRLAPEADQWVVEEQLLKGSCPFLYAWDGEAMRFVTDLLWGAPAGLPVAPGAWAAADPSELVLVPGAAPRDGRYELRVTEELWEAAYYDHARLWVVDHPADVEVASSLRIVPGQASPETVLGARDVRPVAAARDAAGRDVTDRVARRDEIYADGWEPSAYQGLAAAPWTFTVDLGAAPATPVRLLLDGWIFPADASLNLAVAQRRDPPRATTRLEVETDGGWTTLVADLGVPAGKTKTMVVDTPPLPPGARRLRVVSDLWLSWDRIAWTTDPADATPRVVARLHPASAQLAHRGFSALVRRAPNAPHTYDYGRVSTESPWLPFPGRYTRYGDVRELVLAADDRSVILAAGDELALSFDAAALPPPPPGFRRAVFLESWGWDKDADRNTWAAESVEPLPFRAMSGYPYGPGERFPDAPEHRDYRARWLTRVVEPAAPGPGGR